MKSSTRPPSHIKVYYNHAFLSDEFLKCFDIFEFFHCAMDSDMASDWSDRRDQAAMSNCSMLP